MSESPKVPLVSFLMLAMYASFSSITAKTFGLLQPHFRLPELHQSDQGMLPNKFS